MCDSLLSATQWAQAQFEFAQLGDKRLNDRLVKIGQRLAANPLGTLPGSFPDWAELKAAYRFFSSARATYDQIIAPHVERTRTSCREPGEYLIIEDTTLLDYTGRPLGAGLGHIGDKGRGFELHSSLAVRIEGWRLDQRPEGLVVGIFGQSCVAPRPAPRGENRRDRLQRPRKSQRWTEAFKIAGVPPAGAKWIYIADCESDFYEPIQTCQQHQVDFIIRSYQRRRLADEQGTLAEAMSSAPVLGLMTVELRARGAEPARTATVELRAMRVDLDGPWRPEGWQEPLRNIAVLEVREISPTTGAAEPLLWRLLTSLTCETLAQAQRVVGRYQSRWLIEEYHKAIKTGTKVEESQLENGARLQPLIAVLAVVAIRLLNTKLLARSRPERCEAEQSLGPEFIKLLEAKFGKPEKGWTNQRVMFSVARVGGFIGRKGDGSPGWQNIWRGWQRLRWMCEGLEILNNT